MRFMTGSMCDVRFRTDSKVAMKRGAGGEISPASSTNRHYAAASPVESPKGHGAMSTSLLELGAGFRPCTRLFYGGEA